MKNEIKNKKILITGVAGFIGYHLTKRLLKDNTIYGIDNLSTGSIKNIEELKSIKDFKFIEGDISKKEDLKEIWNEKFDIIFNLACPANPDYCFSHPIDVMKTCFEGAFNMCNIAKNNNSTVVQFSTSEVYGDPLIDSQDETYFGNVNTTGDRSCYEEGKRIAETIFFEMHKKYGLDTKILRVFNTYGPHMQKRDGRVIVNFINRGLKNETMEVYGDGKQTRSFCYVDDLVNGVLCTTNYDKNKFDIFNLGNPDEHTINEMAKIIKECLNSKSEIKNIAAKYDDPRKRRPNIDKAKRELKWKPVVTLKDGLTKCIEYYKEELENEEK